jgi:hypothetical protein
MYTVSTYKYGSGPPYYDRPYAQTITAMFQQRTAGSTQVSHVEASAQRAVKEQAGAD